MENPSPKYISGTFREHLQENSGCLYPFLTISREYGCPSKLVAKMLEEALNKKQALPKGIRWRTINKEIVMEAARELNLNPTRVNSIFSTEYHGDFEDVLASFSSNYKSNRRIHKTIRDVVKSFVKNGYIILVGRAGVAITHECPNALHIRLQAPMEWRIRQICERSHMASSEALKKVTDMDKKRTLLIEHFLGKKFDPSIFDLIYNCKSFGLEEIVTSIIHAMEQKKMI
jgi:cytidylate kinase